MGKPAVLHILHNGKIICGMKMDENKELPLGNSWTWLHNSKKSNCPKCLKKAEKIKSRK